MTNTSILTKAVDLSGLDLEEAARKINDVILSVCFALSTTSKVVDVQIVPLVLGTRNAGRDEQGEYDYPVTHSGVLLTFKTESR